MLQFGAEVTQILNKAYEGADLTRRRQASFDALRPSPGETILDVGCGNGLLTAELARATGPEGKVIGVDPSKDMLAAAKKRCADFGSVSFVNGVADAIPLKDAVADKAVSVQTFEYIEDVSSAVDNVMRCLKPGGRLVISDLHFGTLVWTSDDPARMAQMISSWDQHFASGILPERLPSLLADKGHKIETVAPFTMTDHELKPDGIAIMMMHLMKQYAIAKRHVEEAVAQAWFEEQFHRAKEGRFFFSLTQFVVVASKAT